MKFKDQVIGVVMVHAPNKRRARVQFWQELQELVRDGNWVILGDFNQIEIPDDSSGRTALLRGREERMWRGMVAEQGFVDCYFCSANVQGPRFTHFAKRNDRVDFSRLDRLYLTKGAEWLDHVKEVTHNAHTALSDHVPVSGILQLAAETQGRKPENYFKFNHFDLKDPEIFQKVKDRMEKRLKEHELQEARIWRIRCREKWLTEDDAPSRYFFAKLKAKWARDSLTVLQLDDGEVTEDQEVILEEIQKFYQCLYTKEDESEDRVRAREEVMSLIQNRISADDSRKVSSIPEEEEIKGVVFSMKLNKAPGSDGLTVEVVRHCWEFVGDCCVKMVKAVWVKRRLLKADMQGIIKLIHKGGDRKLLGNWRPISLMSLTYKIVSKIIANRVKTLLPNLIDPQQTGFVMGRRISDNILSPKIGQEWAEWSGQEALFVKLDFIKAYDRVDHCFLWRTLTEMGIDQHFVELIQGITLGGSAKVHINRAFTSAIQVDRGVRQGCPLAPLLFAIVSTQESHFQELMRILEKYGLVSGAKINLRKSLIMSIGRERVPDWARDLGCEIAEGESSFKYLGIRVGAAVSDQEVASDAFIRIQKRLEAWENRYLPWPARVLLIKHILSQIPAYLMLIVGCRRLEAKKLETIYRSFLWGTTAEGRPKKALIAWSKVVKEKTAGGLGFQTFESRARALQMRYATEILEGQPSEWLRMLRRMIWLCLLSRVQKKERSKWSYCDALLLLPGLRLPLAPTVDKILQVWFFAKKFLRWPATGVELPKWLPVVSLDKIWALMGKEPATIFKRLNAETRKRKCWYLRDIVSSQGGIRRFWLEVCQPTSVQDAVIDTEARGWLSQIWVSDMSLIELKCWKWTDGCSVERGWKRSAKEWCKLLYQEVNSAGVLNRGWETVAEPDVWKWRWQKLWSGISFLREKIWCWRLLQLGLPTLERAKKWGVSDGLCPMCSGDLENIDHLMWGCRMIQNRVEWLQEFVFPTENRSGGLLQAIDDCLRIHDSCPVNLLLLLEHCRSCWNERNKFVFEGVTGRTTLWRVIATVKTEVSCLSRRWVEEKRADFVEKSARAIEVAEVSLRSMLRRQREMDLLVQEFTRSLEFDPSASPRQRKNGNERSRIRERDGVSNSSDQNLDIVITQEECSESQSISSYDNTMSSFTGEERIVDVAEA
ncbi:hypothetical protein R1sor_024189 [Riccia sorocarpa]|uniref:Reverse transcriptase domain-containing protein n=1 Tax=Riccia sorocarpa TaxID=122646 RepID=A0ABD3GQJ8_9MARC